MEEKLIERLKDLYRGRKNIESKLVINLRYGTDTEKIKEHIILLSEYRGRVQEIENLLDSNTINKIKNESNISTLTQNY